LASPPVPTTNAVAPPDDDAPPQAQPPKPKPADGETPADPKPADAPKTTAIDADTALGRLINGIYATRFKQAADQLDKPGADVAAVLKKLDEDLVADLQKLPSGKDVSADDLKVTAHARVARMFRDALRSTR